MADIKDTLAERGKTYGDFAMQAELSQMLKTCVTQSPGHTRMQPYQREAMEMILHKISRILNGDPNHADSWHDIAGYAMLVETHLSAGPKPAERWAIK